jgi:hypothetical protein
MWIVSIPAEVQLAYEQGAQRISELKTMLVGINDPGMHGLAISNCRDASRTGRRKHNVS